tara:strand:+ start:1267 stop:2340 length:1074 start_codon:yes stop_codon:yes gene_type:complete
MSTIRVTYTPQTSSDSMSPAMCHRICYREAGGTDYCCLTDDTDSEAGTPKYFDITVGAIPCNLAVPPVDTESCFTTVYEGYVQACCENEASLDGRVAWTATFQPDPTCLSQLVCCTSSMPLQQDYITIVNAGANYDDALSPLPITIIRTIGDSESNDASFTVTILGGVITAVNQISPGLYSKMPTIIVPSPTLGAGQAELIAVIPCYKVFDVWGDHEGFKANCVVSPEGVEEATLLLDECVIYCFPNDKPFIYYDGNLNTPNTVDYTYTVQGCCDCTTCRNYVVYTGSSINPITLVYTQCSSAGGEAIMVVLESPGSDGSGVTSLDCVVPGSIYCIDDPNAIISIVDNGVSACCVPS